MQNPVFTFSADRRKHEQTFDGRKVTRGVTYENRNRGTRR